MGQKDLFSKKMEIPAKSLECMIAGMFIAAFFRITLGMLFCFFPLIFIAVIVVFVKCVGKEIQCDWKALAFFAAGGAVIQVLTLI